MGPSCAQASGRRKEIIVAGTPPSALFPGRFKLRSQRPGRRAVRRRKAWPARAGRSQAPAGRGGDGSLAQGQDIRVVVLAPPAGGVEAPAERAPHAAHLVGHHRLPVPGTAQHDAPIAFAAGHRFGRRPDVGRVIHRRLALGAEVVHPMPQALEQGLDLLLVNEPGVIGSQRNFHGTTLPDFTARPRGKSDAQRLDHG